MQGWTPNYIDIEGIQASRVNVMAIIIDKQDNSLKVEDGTGSIECRLFNETINIEKLKVGDIVLIIAKPREYEQKKYLVPEIVKKIDNKKWIEYRKKELELINYKPVKQEQNIEVKEEPTTNKALLVLEKIKELDKGEGVLLEDLLKELDLEESDKYIDLLLNEGEIFEIKPGRLKIL